MARSSAASEHSREHRTSITRSHAAAELEPENSSTDFTGAEILRDYIIIYISVISLLRTTFSRCQTQADNKPLAPLNRIPAVDIFLQLVQGKSRHRWGKCPPTCMYMWEKSL